MGHSIDFHQSQQTKNHSTFHAVYVEKKKNVRIKVKKKFGVKQECYGELFYTKTYVKNLGPV